MIDLSLTRKDSMSNEMATELAAPAVPLTDEQLAELLAIRAQPLDGEVVGYAGDSAEETEAQAS